MENVGVIDRFLLVFTRYIDSGFGLLGAEASWLAGALVVIDVTLAALFWAWGADDDILARLVKKTLFAGVFAWLIGNWNQLAKIVFESFAGLGLRASGTGLSESEFLRPGRIAAVGMEAGRPLLEAIANLMGYVSFFENFVQIVILLFAWAVVSLSFFILAVQLFVTLIEFKLTTLAGFILIPFGLFGKTAFAAERVLGNVISSGVKILVLAVIVGIGSTLFSQFTVMGAAAQPTIDDALTIILASLSLLGLGIFGPGIANGIVSGGPQLGAGAALGANLAAGGMAAAGAGVASVAGSSLTQASSKLATGGSYAAGVTAAAWRSRGATGVAEAARDAVTSPLRSAAATLRSGFTAGANGNPSAPLNAGGATAGNPPQWARRMRQHQLIHMGASQTVHAVRSSHEGGGGASVDLSEGQ